MLAWRELDDSNSTESRKIVSGVGVGGANLPFWQLLKKKTFVSGQVEPGVYKKGDVCVRVSVFEVAVLTARLRWHSVQDGAELVAWVARILQFRRRQS